MEQTQTNNPEVKNVVAPAPAGAPVDANAKPFNKGGRPPFRGGPRGNDADRRGGQRRGGPRRDVRGERAKPEFDQKIIDIRRVARVVAGGKRFSFSVTLVAGNRKGMVGVGMGKAADTSMAIDKALRDAKKNMLRLKLTKTMSIPHEVEVKYCSAIVKLMPAKDRGLTAGSSVRHVLELAGIKDVSAKLLSGTKNRVNISKVAIKALEMFAEPKNK